MYEYRAVVRKVHDGDTITVDVDLGFGFWAHAQQMRLLGIQAPELNTEQGVKARDYLLTLIPLDSYVEIHTIKDKREKYGRMLADVYRLDRNGERALLVNKALLDARYAVEWNGKGARPLGF